MKKECSICGEKFDFVYQKGEQFPPYFPFCSSRCKQIDLARWLNEKYQISSPITGEELTTKDEEALADFLPDEVEDDCITDEKKTCADQGIFTRKT